MKYKYAYCALATSIATILSNQPLAQASSIQIMAPSTSKIQIIGTKKQTSPKPNIKDGPERMKKASNNKMLAKPVAAEPITSPIPVMPQMRTGDAELPIVQVNETKSK